jgi:hypothetical protein
VRGIPGACAAARGCSRSSGGRLRERRLFWKLVSFTRRLAGRGLDVRISLHDEGIFAGVSSGQSGLRESLGRMSMDTRLSTFEAFLFNRQ